MNSYVKRLSLVAAALTVAAVLFVPAILHGDEFDLKTYITVNQPFQLPGAVLQPNTKYVLKRVDHGTTDPHVLRVMNADENQVLSTFFAISAERIEPADNTILTFYETAPGYAKPAREWFYPGRTIGYEFVYPKDKHNEIMAHLVGAQPAVVETAQALPEALPEETPAPTDQIAQNTEPEVQREKPAEPEATEPAPAPTTDMTEKTEPETSAAPENNAAPSELPRTAGELPLLVLAGLASLGMRRALRRG